MRKNTPDTETMKISEVKSQLSRLVNEVYRGEKRILIEKSGIPVAALVSMEALELLARFEAQQREAWDVIEAMRAPFRGIPPEEIEREVAAIVREMRDEREAAMSASVDDTAERRSA